MVFDHPGLKLIPVLTYRTTKAVLPFV